MAISGLGSGVGATLDYTLIAPGTGTLTQVIQVLALSISGQTCGITDITNPGVTDHYSEFLPTLLDAGSISLVVRYGSTLGTGSCETFGELQDLFDLREIGTYKITLPGGSYWSCKGFMTRLEVVGQYKSGIQQRITIKCTGKPTWTEVT